MLLYRQMWIRNRTLKSKYFYKKQLPNSIKNSQLTILVPNFTLNNNLPFRFNPTTVNQLFYFFNIYTWQTSYSTLKSLYNTLRVLTVAVSKVHTAAKYKVPVFFKML